MNDRAKAQKIAEHALEKVRDAFNETTNLDEYAVLSAFKAVFEDELECWSGRLAELEDELDEDEPEGQ